MTKTIKLIGVLALASSMTNIVFPTHSVGEVEWFSVTDGELTLEKLKAIVEQVRQEREGSQKIVAVPPLELEGAAERSSWRLTVGSFRVHRPLFHWLPEPFRSSYPNPYLEVRLDQPAPANGPIYRVTANIAAQEGHTSRVYGNIPYGTILEVVTEKQLKTALPSFRNPNEVWFGPHLRAALNAFAHPIAEVATRVVR